MRWAASVPAHRMWMSVITLFEIDHGIAREERRDPVFAADLQRWRDQSVGTAFQDRIVPVDQRIAAIMARLAADVGTAKLPDLIVGATAFSRGMMLATRNTHDFEAMRAGGSAISLVDPWGKS